MTEEPTAAAPNKNRRFIGVALVSVGVLILAFLGLCVVAALNLRISLTGSLPELFDFAQAMAILSPVILLALLLIGFGRRLLRKG
jgi:hypothetical protein